MKPFRPLTVISLVFVNSVVLAGRPVFHDFNLEPLVARSNVVAIVEKKQPFKVRSRQVAGQCEEMRWPSRVENVLFSQVDFQDIPGVALIRPSKVKREEVLKGLVVPGKDIEVLFNEVALEDCLNRIPNKSGASFYARRYQPSDPGLVEHSSKFILFLVVRDKALSLTVINAFEPISKQRDVEEAIKKVRELKGNSPTNH
jgi:hypothetical protein